MLIALQKWLAAQGGLAHLVASGYLISIAAYAAVPAFAHLVNTVYSQFPQWAHEFVLALLGVIAWYTKTHKSIANVAQG